MLAMDFLYGPLTPLALMPLTLLTRRCVWFVSWPMIWSHSAKHWWQRRQSGKVPEYPRAQTSQRGPETPSTQTHWPLPLLHCGSEIPRGSQSHAEAETDWWLEVCSVTPVNTPTVGYTCAARFIMFVLNIQLFWAAVNIFRCEVRRFMKSTESADVWSLNFTLMFWFSSNSNCSFTKLHSRLLKTPRLHDQTEITRGGGSQSHGLFLVSQHDRTSLIWA